MFFLCYHGVLSDGVVALLQVLQLQLGDVVFGHLGTFQADGVQQGTVAEHLLVEQLRTTTGNRKCFFIVCTVNMFSSLLSGL